MRESRRRESAYERVWLLSARVAGRNLGGRGRGGAGCTGCRGGARRNCPFNYGAVPAYLGLEGDLLDALVLGKRLPYGTQLRVKAWGAVMMTDRGMCDDKLVCSSRSPSDEECREVLRFFHFYARCKGLLNLWRRRPGRNGCDGWCDANEALARARPVSGSWAGSPVPF